MPQQTLVVVGPGGVGKSPLDALFRPDIARIDPYRLRASGPRDHDDTLYAHPKLRQEISGVLAALGDRPAQIGPFVWFARSRTLFFKVRADWQLLILHDLDADVAKAEIHGPILVALLAEPTLSYILGQVTVVLLNPASRSVLEMPDWHELEQKTEINCRRRGDSEESVLARIRSIPKEAPSWQQLILAHGATEFVNWQYPEYRYRADPVTLAEARRCLVETNPSLEFFLRPQ